MTGVTSSNLLIQERSLRLLVRALKALSASIRTKDLLQSLSPSLFTPLYQQWSAHVGAFASGGLSDASLMHLERALLFLRALRQLYVYGIGASTTETEEMVTFARNCTELVSILVAAVSNPSTPESLTSSNSILLRTLRVLGKLLSEYQERRPYHFVRDAAFGPLMQLILGLLATEGPLATRHISLEPFLIQILLLCKATMKSIAYSRPELKGQFSDVRDRLAALWTDECITTFAKILLANYMPLSPGDLTMWEEDAEEFASADDSEAWRVIIRVR